MSNEKMSGLIPVSDGWLSQKFNKSKHKGIDIGFHAVEHCPVRAWNDGTVFAWGADAARAWFVVLKHDNGQLSGYWHLKNCPKVITGQHVRRGDVLGLRGNSGNSSGTHLHFLLTDCFDPEKYNYNEMLNHVIDPLKWLYRLESDTSYVPGVDNINLLDLPLQTKEIDPEALKKVIDANVKNLITNIFNEVGYNVNEYSLVYKIERK